MLARAFDRELSAGVDRLYLDDESYVLEPDFLPAGATVRRGAISWRYDGQQVFSDVDDSPVGTVPLVEPLYLLTGIEYDPEGYFGVGSAVRVDRFGRRWVVDAIDVPAIAEELAAYGARFGSEATGSADGGSLDAAEPGIEFNTDPAPVQWVELTSWSFEQCNSQRTYWTHNGNGAMEQSPPIDATSPKRAIVWVLTPFGTDCSGTLVAGDDPGELAILTAAHCVTDAEGNPGNPNAFDVCTLENLSRNTHLPSVARCFGIEEIIKSPGWTGDDPYDVTQDYALLTIDDIDPLVEPIAMNTTHEDATVEGLEAFHRGYALYKPGLPECTSNDVTDPNLIIDPSFHGRYMVQAAGDVQATPTGYVKYDVSTCRGCSGSPHFFCPSGNCDLDAQVSGVQTHKYMGVGNRWVGGPKVKDLSAWAIPLIPYVGPESCASDDTHCNCPLWEDTLRCKYDGIEWNPDALPPGVTEVREAQDNPEHPNPVAPYDFSLVVFEDYSARCADGTWPAIYVDRAVDASGNDMLSNKWIIAIPGGGSCAPYDSLGTGALDLGPSAFPNPDPPPAPDWILQLGAGIDPFEPYCGPCYLRLNEIGEPFNAECGGLRQVDFSSGTEFQTADLNGVLRPNALNPFADYNRVWVDKCGADSYRGRVRWQENGGALLFQTTSEPGSEEPGGVYTPVDFYQEGNLQLELVLRELRDGLEYTDYANNDPDAQLPPLADLEQLLFIGHSGAAGGLPYYIDQLTQQVNAMGDGGPPKDVRVVLDAWHIPSIENEVGCRDGLDATGSCASTGFDAYDHVWIGESEANDEDIKYDPTTADALFVEADIQVRADTWLATTDLSCLLSHPPHPIANPHQRECRGGTHLVLNHVSTPMFIKQDFSDYKIATLGDPNEEFHLVQWAVTVPPGGQVEFDYRTCPDPPVDCVVSDPNEYKARLDLQATTMFDWFSTWSELATGEDPTFAPNFTDTPTIYGFFPDCQAIGFTHEGLFSDPYFGTANPPGVTIGGIEYRHWLEQWADDAYFNEQQDLITRTYADPAQLPFTEHCPGQP